MDLVGFIYGFGALQGFTLCVILLVNSRGNRTANALMAALIAVISLHLINLWLVRAGFYLKHPQWVTVISAIRFTWGPLLYLYARCVTKKSLDARQLLHFIPYLLLVAVGIPYLFYPEDQQIALLNYVWQEGGDPNQIEQYPGLSTRFLVYWFGHHLHGTFFAIQFGIYCILVLRLIRQLNQKLQQYYSSLEWTNLRWLRAMAWICLLFMLLFLVFNRSSQLLDGYVDMGTLSANTPYLFMVVGIYFIGFMALYQPSILKGIKAVEDTGRPDGEPSAKPPIQQGAQDAEPATAGIEPKSKAQVKIVKKDDREKPESEKYQRSTLTPEDAETYAVRLKEVMEEEELYLDCDLTMPDLAKHAEIAPYLVSQVLNGPMHQSFFGFVNSYRISLAKEMMTDPNARKLAIVDLALEVGFKSKSSFYDAFKKVTQMNPTQFKKSLSL
jgi:AraC-like DNA-binding protein